MPSPRRPKTLVHPGDFVGMVEAFLKTSSQPLMMIDLDSLRFLKANQRAADLLGRSGTELLRKRADQVSSLTPPLLAGLLPAQGEKPVYRTAKLFPKDGRTIEVSVAALPCARERTALVFVASDSLPEPLRSIPPAASAATGRTSANDSFPSIVGESREIREVCRLIGLVAKSHTTVLVQGESGTGKELVANAVHFHSRRAKRALVKVNCAALAESLLESELFGHRRGSFTGAVQDRVGRFALADKGTIVLDEIGSMPMSGQAKLLRVLQEQEFEPVGESRPVRVDVRVIAVTNVDLAEASRRGEFREDLFYRLSAFPITVPPLRQRRLDIPQLARHFLKNCSSTLGKSIEDFEVETLSALMDHPWPGNVRELENAIEYAAILETEPRLRPSSLPAKFEPCRRKEPTLRDRLQSTEKEIILETLSKCNWVKKRAARLLGIDRRNLSYFLHKHNIH